MNKVYDYEHEINQRVNNSEENLNNCIRQNVDEIRKHFNVMELCKKDVSSNGAMPIKAVKKTKKIKKAIFTSVVLGVIVVATIVGKYVDNKNKIDNAFDYISSNISSDVELVLSDENFLSNANMLIDEMTSKGMSEDSALFFIKETYGNKVFDKILQSKGYKDGGAYIVDEGYVDKYIKNSFSGVPDDNAYEAAMEKQLVEEVNKIKEGRNVLK